MTPGARIKRSLTVYPVTVLYIAGSLIAWLVAADALALGVGLVLLAIVAVLMLAVGMWREVRFIEEHHELCGAERHSEDAR